VFINVISGEHLVFLNSASFAPSAVNQ